ncbi:MAG: hypothetical protein LBS26_02510 [Campylobacteraceae bacterium]|jgi:hypothetical protein|nr:hypothetical protein [Campylobacteraceae bacterium]
MNTKKVFSNSLILYIVLFFGAGSAQTQSEQSKFSNDTIKVETTPLGYRFRYQNTAYSYSQIMEIMQSCPEAVNIMNISQKQNIAANLTGFIGGYGVGGAAGWALGRIKRYGELDTQDIVIIATTGGLGIIFCGLTFYFSRQSRNNMYAAVKLFNRQAFQFTGYQGVKLDVGINTNGVGFRMTF